MRTYLLLFPFLFVGYYINAQFIEDFSDGDFTAGNLWQGNDTEFIINANQELQLNNVGASVSQLSTSNMLTDLDSVEWQLYVKQSFSPSGSNNGKIYLASDQSNLTGSLNGYYILLGEAGSADAVSLYEQTGTTSTLVCTGTAGAVASSFELGLKVYRNHLGNWEIYTDYTGGTNYTLDASGTNTTHNTSAFIGVVCTYTSSNSTDFYFDDFYAGDYILDLTPPDVLSAIAISATQVDLLFDEDLNQITAETVGNYIVDNGIGSPTSVVLDGTNLALVHLTLSTALTNGTNYNITTSNVTDLSGNALSSSIDNFTYFVPATPAYKDVVINEIFADPSPQIGLPEEEFIEIYNRTGAIFDLNGWQISDGTSTATMGTYVFMPSEYLIICSDADTALFSPFGNTLGVPSFPSLNNTGDNLTLTDGGVTIDDVNYTDAWYKDNVKEDGGYSLELINPTIPCTDPGNFIGSFDASGGTPGNQNSIADFSPDIAGPSIVDAYVYSSDSIKVVFSEGLDPAALGGLTLTFSNGLGYMESIDNNTPTCLWIQVSVSLVPGDAFTIDIDGLTDCSGNTMASDQVSILVPEKAIFNDLVINEVLFNPLTGGSDFVEIYNRSNKSIDLSNYALANFDNDTIDNNKIVSATTYILEPGGYVVLTADSSDVKTDYPRAIAGSFIEMDGLPSYNNDSSTVFLIDDLESIVDQFSYTDDMHFVLLNSDDGVSLERLDPFRESTEMTNWHSAAENVGYATPGYLNSQAQSIEGSDISNSIILEPEIFSPDNDGYDDILNISYLFDEVGYVASVAVYDAHGRLVAWIAQNTLLASAGTLSWDGTINGIEKAPIGTYVLFFEVFNLGGDVQRFKKPCVLAGRL